MCPVVVELVLSFLTRGMSCDLILTQSMGKRFVAAVVVTFVFLKSPDSAASFY